MEKKKLKILKIVALMMMIILSSTMFFGCKKQEKSSYKLSIIVPIYNSQDYLSTAIDSLINQTYKNIEIVCVNDGSNDGSLDMLNQYKEKDNRVVVVDKPNGGVSSARNEGIKASTGDYITFVDSDDYIDLDAYENCINKIKENNADILAFGFKFEPSQRDGTNVSDKVYDKWECIENEFVDNGTVWNKIFSRSIIVDNNIWFAEDVKYGEDDLFIKMVAPHANIIAGHAKPYYHYVYRETSAENSYGNEKRLVSAVNRVQAFVDDYTKNQYTDEYDWVLSECLRITYDRINTGLDDDSKKKMYSEQVLKVLDEQLLPLMDSVPEQAQDNLDQLRAYANM